MECSLTCKSLSPRLRAFKYILTVNAEKSILVIKSNIVSSNSDLFDPVSHALFGVLFLVSFLFLHNCEKLLLGTYHHVLMY